VEKMDLLNIIFESKKKENEKNTKEKKKVPKTSQQTVPFKKLYENGLIEVKDNEYSIILNVTNINYLLAKEEDKKEIFNIYSQFLNSLDNMIRAQWFLLNDNVNESDILATIPEHAVNTKHDIFLEEYREIIRGNLNESNDKTSEKKLYLVISTNEKSPKEADTTLQRVVGDTIVQFNKLDSKIKQLTSTEIIELFYILYNSDLETKTHVEVPLSKNFFKSGTSVKDFIAPSSFKFKINHIQVGETFERVLFIRQFPTQINDLFLSNVSEAIPNTTISVHIQPTDPGDAITFIKRKLTGMEANKIDLENRKRFISHELKNNIEATKELLDSIQKDNQKLFFLSIYIVVRAKTLEELEDRTKIIQQIARKHLCICNTCTHQQEDALATALPLGLDRLSVKRTMLTDSTAIFIPFSSQEIYNETGFYYGKNTISKSMIIFDRKKLINPSGFILGIPGSGKSFSAKREIENVILTTKDDVIILDPEREYSLLAKNFGGEVIKIAADSKNYINPMDLDKDYSDEGSPLLLKAEFVVGLCDALMGGLKLAEKTIIDRAVRKTYAEYVNTDFDKNKQPTLKDFYEVLLEQPESEAKQVALALEIYVNGSLNIFSNKTNIETNNRFLVFDTKDLGKQLKQMGMYIVLDFIWNRICANRDKGVRTWLYLDEIYLLFASEYTANFLFELYKRARKYGGIPTGITQNIEDLLRSDTARTLLSNSQFLLLFNQAPSDREEMSKLLKTSPAQMSYVTNAEPGSGLLISGKNIIPFTDSFPMDTKLYQMMTTRIEEVAIQNKK
jgi:NADH:ubiquinone oxidoreductase subunit C